MFPTSYRSAVRLAMDQEVTLVRRIPQAIESHTERLTTSRYTMPLLFPALDSFPSIFDVGTGRAEKLAVHAGLTTSTAVAEQVRAIEQIVKRLVAVDEREALCNGLQVIAEEYDEGWDGDFTDSDDDD
jgi:hypothetical protein